MKAKNIRLLYIHEIFFQFTTSLMIVVMPVFLYRLFGSISVVFLWTLIWNLVYAFIVIPILNLSLKYGPKYFMVIGTVLYFVYMLMFGAMENHPTLFIPATVVMAFSIACYWMSRHWFFSVNADFATIGKQVSLLAVIRMAVTFLGPIVGGLASFYFSFNAAMVLGAASIAIGLIPVLFFQAPPPKEHYSYTKIREVLKKPELKVMRGAYFWEGFSVYVIQTGWILAFAIFIGNIKQLGILVGCTTLIAALLTRLTGHFFDQKKRTQLLTKVTGLQILASLMYASIYFFPYTIYIWITDTINKFSGSMHTTILDSYLYGYSSKIHPVHFHLNREIHLTLGRIICNTLLVILFLRAPENTLWLIIAIGAFMLLPWFHLKRSDHLLH